jgi:hypothetical protein
MFARALAQLVQAVKVIFGVALILALLALLAILFFLPPVALFFETWDLPRLRATAPATITRVERIVHDETTRPVIAYEYTVGGKHYTSSRLMPGFFGNIGGWTGGDRLLKQYRVGQKVDIYYDPNSPARTALLYGWFVMSLGFTTVVWCGIVLPPLANSIQSPGRADALRATGIVGAVYGFLLMFTHTAVLSPREGVWHLLAIAVAWPCVFAWLAWNRRSAEAG